MPHSTAYCALYFLFNYNSDIPRRQYTQTNFFYYSIKAERARFSSSEKQKIFLFADAIKFLPYMPRSLLGRGGNDGEYYFKSKNPAGLRNAEFAAQMFDYIAHVFYAVAVLVAFGLAC